MWTIRCPTNWFNLCHVISPVCNIWLFHILWPQKHKNQWVLQVLEPLWTLLVVTYLVDLRMWTSLSYDYLYCFQYDQGLPSNDHSFCFSPVFLVSLYIIYGTSSIYDRMSIYDKSNVRNRKPIVLCSQGMSIIVRDSFQPIKISPPLRAKQAVLWCQSKACSGYPPAFLIVLRRQSKSSFACKARPEMVIFWNLHHLLLETYQL